MKTKILMVCLGNICRSPLAEGILKSKLDDNIFFVDSAGIGNWHQGEAPDQRSIKVAKNHKIDISNQRARQFSIKDFDQFDYIYAMDNNNYNDIISLAIDQKSKDKVKMISNELFENQNIDVLDPYWGTENDFEEVYKMLNEICTKIAEKLTKF